MKIQTYSILAGSEACNAKCPYCVSRMTPTQGIDLKEPKVNWRNFDIGSKFAKDSGVSTVLITGKGEPTLFPKQITNYMSRLKPYGFSFIELQTNGIALLKKNFEKYLKNWYDLGMTTIAISIVHYDNEKNKQIFQNGSMDLTGLINKLHSGGYSVRLSCTMIKDFIDDVGGIEKLVQFAKDNKIGQVSIRKVEKPEKSRNKEISDWIEKNEVEKSNLKRIRKFLDEKGTEVMRLVHGAIVYDLYGQNICLTNALTLDPKSEEVRQLIFFPDGHLRYDWQYPGAILL